MLFVVDGKLRTFFGWSPGLRITLGGRVLPCRCLVGSYETWRGDVVEILDAHDERCTERGHATDLIVGYSKRSRQSMSLHTRPLRASAELVPSAGGINVESTPPQLHKLHARGDRGSTRS